MAIPYKVYRPADPRIVVIEFYESFDVFGHSDILADDFWKETVLASLDQSPGYEGVTIYDVRQANLSYSDLRYGATAFSETPPDDMVRCKLLHNVTIVKDSAMMNVVKSSLGLLQLFGVSLHLCYTMDEALAIANQLARA